MIVVIHIWISVWIIWYFTIQAKEKYSAAMYYIGTRVQKIEVKIQFFWGFSLIINADFFVNLIGHRVVNYRATSRYRGSHYDIEEEISEIIDRWNILKCKIPFEISITTFFAENMCCPVSNKLNIQLFSFVVLSIRVILALLPWSWFRK